MQVTNDTSLNIATATSRKATKWQNRSVRWSQLLDRLAACQRTPETMAEYKRMSHDRQSDVKDVGGFVGGVCRNGKRSDTTSRSLVTLDADFDDGHVWEDYKTIYSNAAAVYSTHKHRTEAPRLRLVVPLDRDVSPDEYQAIARRIAQTLGIEKFDDTTYQPQRLMFWPSASCDAPFIFDNQDGPITKADDILATYADWKDLSTWPVSSRVAEAPHKAAEKQEDPLTKPGLIGAFCRAYSIEEAISEFVPDYEAAGEGRYTYTKGTTAGGVVTYDHKFSYSHHDTDPASCQLCNAWDLVRIHKFGHLDEAATEGTTPTNLPSYKAMAAFATDDTKVKAEIISERERTAAADFEAYDDAETTGPEQEQEQDQKSDNDWKGRLSFTAKGEIASTIDNIAIILDNDPRLKDHLAINDFEHTLTVTKNLPWRKLEGEEKRNGGAWTDNDDSNLRHYIEKVYGISSKDKIFDAVAVVAERNSFHPVRDYLDRCAIEWDGTSRVPDLLIKYLGAANTDYVRQVTTKTLTAAVARIYDPACKFDYMLTLRGAQGIGKSTLIRKLAGDWYSDSFNGVQGKDAYENIQGRWIIEVGELAGVRKAEAEAVKLFISKQTDRYRPAYGRRSVNFPRQCIFIATTNEQEFLKDTTGNRRYWVVDTPNPATGDLWKDLDAATIRQIWGEAVAIYRKGEKLFLDKEMEEEARRVQEAYTEEDSQTGLVEAYLERKLPRNWNDFDTMERRAFLAGREEGENARQYVCNIEIWVEVLNGDPAKLDRINIKRIQGIMSAIPGWTYKAEAKKSFSNYGRQRFYTRNRSK